MKSNELKQFLLLLLTVLFYSQNVQARMLKLQTGLTSFL